MSILSVLKPNTASAATNTNTASTGTPTNSNKNVQIPSNEQNKLEDKRRKRRLIFAGVIASISLVLLGVWWLKQRRMLRFLTERRKQNKSANEIPVAGPEEEAALEQALGRAAVNNETPKLSQDDLVELANQLKVRGFQLMGSSHCIWTKRQREFFGTSPKDPARKILETIYHECVSARDPKCSTLPGFPTWINERKKGGKGQWPGFRDEVALKTMLNEVGDTVEIEEIEEEQEPAPTPTPAPAAVQAPAPVEEAPAPVPAVPSQALNDVARDFAKTIRSLTSVSATA